MALKLMYITNQPEIAQIAESAGVERVWVDMEYIWKAKRQGGMDTVQSHHTIEDVKKIRKVIKKSDLLVRVNPIHEAAKDYGSSKEEIKSVIDAGADIIMLPYFKTVEEVQIFIELVNGKAKVLPLLETPDAVEVIDEILDLQGIDEVFIGLNDLSLGYKKTFMFELLGDGSVERLGLKFKQREISYGFGGITYLGDGEVALPAENVIKEHYRLKSSSVILSRSFFDTRDKELVEKAGSVFPERVQRIRTMERECEKHKQDGDDEYFHINQQMVMDKIAKCLKDSN